MRFIDHESRAKEEWRTGVMTRMVVSAENGASQLCVFEQWCDPGRGAPTHVHAVEEILSVLDGEAEIWVEDERRAVRPGQSVVVPAGYRHGFRNTGTSVLHVRATLASPIFEATFEDRNEITRRWLPPKRSAAG